MSLCSLRAHAGPIVLFLTSCDLDSQQAPRVELDVVVDASGIADFENAEGYSIRITRIRAAFSDVELTSSGEMHASLWRDLGELVIPTAYAHPGHSAGGEVLGEMDGRFVVDWLDDGVALGTATMLVGDYTGANFVFTRATAEDLSVGDTLIGHTFEIAGEATRAGTTTTFSMFLDEDDGRRVVGLPLELTVDAGSDETIGLQMFMVDPVEGDTAFDNVDFAALDEDADGVVVIEPSQPVYNVIKKQLQVHDLYGVTLR